MRKCSICGRTEGRVIKSKGIYYCSRCYQRKNRKVYPLPPYGEIKYNEEGNPICHICGEAYKKLMLHVFQVHGLSAYEYKVKFGLPISLGIMSEESKNKIRQKTYSNKKIVIDKNLMEGGKNTRFKKGMHFKRYVSAYTRKKLIENMKKIGRNKK